jgi:pimeloyl-ACP methyl ester carboxylesterase
MKLTTYQVLTNIFVMITCIYAGAVPLIVSATNDAPFASTGDGTLQSSISTGASSQQAIFLGQPLNNNPLNSIQIHIKVPSRSATTTLEFYFNEFADSAYTIPFSAYYSGCTSFASLPPGQDFDGYLTFPTKNCFFDPTAYIFMQWVFSNIPYQVYGSPLSSSVHSVNSYGIGCTYGWCDIMPYAGFSTRSQIPGPVIDTFDTGLSEDWNVPCYINYLAACSSTSALATTTNTRNNSAGAIALFHDYPTLITRSGDPQSEGRQVVYVKDSTPSGLQSHWAFVVCARLGSNGDCTGDRFYVQQGQNVGQPVPKDGQYHSVMTAWRNGLQYKESCTLVDSLDTSTCGWSSSYQYPLSETFSTVQLSGYVQSTLYGTPVQGGEVYFDDVGVFPPATTTPPICTVNCNDNVLFLPGIEGSRLYATTTNLTPLATESQLWEPLAPFGGDVPYLDMNNANAVNSVYTKEKRILDSAYFGLHPIYNSFINQMNTLVASGKIVAWKPIAYDWRLDYADLVNYGNQTSDGKIFYRGNNAATSTPYIIQELKRLAQTSRTGKVNIIAHSNGGLVAKELTRVLGTTTASQLISKIIFVATPQLGTPKAVGALLHGYDQALPREGLPVNLTDADARHLASSTPSAYNLLPSTQYFNTIGTPVISFDPLTLPIWASSYGFIHSINGLGSFMTDSTRTTPGYYDTATPSIVNATLFDHAIAIHNDLDNWTPPPGIQLITIAGWGNDTLSSILYKKVIETHCITFSLTNDCLLKSQTSKQTFDPQFVIDGDGTVVDGSAQWTNNTPTSQYWLNLLDYNNNTFLQFKHDNILESQPVQNLLSTLIINAATSTLPQYISTSRPLFNGLSPSIYFIVHSPVTLGFTDGVGNYTGATASSTVFNAPGVDYERFGEVQWLSVPQSLAGQVVMHGTASGSFSLDVEAVNGNQIISTTSFQGIPSATSTVATININPSVPATASSTLVVDYNGDGMLDSTIQSKQGSIVIADITPPEIRISFATSTNSLVFLGIDDSGISTISATTSYPTLKKNQKNYNGIATTTVTARDSSGNTTSLIYTEQLPSPKLRDTIVPITLIYNGATTTIATTTLSYKWRLNPDNTYKLFASYVKTNATSTESHWRPKKNQTVIMMKPIDLDDGDGDDDSDSRPTKIKVPGFVIPYLTTKQGSLIINN